MSTHGHDDPNIPPAARRAHDLAVARGRASYADPDTGYQVLTAAFLRDRGACCGCTCRHCPYPAEAQALAGRRLLRPWSEPAGEEPSGSLGALKGPS